MNMEYPLRPRYVDAVSSSDAIRFLASPRLGRLFSITPRNYLIISYMRVSRDVATSGMLSFLYVLFLLSGASPSGFPARAICSTIGTGIVALLAFLTITHCSLPESVLAIIAAYELVRRSRKECHSEAATRSEDAKMDEMVSYNHFEKTLEEEMVEKLTPVTVEDSQPASYLPLLNDLQDAAPIDYDGVI